MADVTAGLWRLVEEYVSAEGVELDDLEVLGRGRGKVVRIFVDAEGGLDVERIAELSRGISRLLDEEDSVEGSYTLEVSSPGLERRLRRPKQFRKAVGREVVVRTNAPIDGSRRHAGVLRRVGEGEVLVAVEGRARSIPLAEVVSARTVFRWEKAPKPGGKR